MLCRRLFRTCKLHRWMQRERALDEGSKHNCRGNDFKITFKREIFKQSVELFISVFKAALPFRQMGPCLSLCGNHLLISTRDSSTFVLDSSHGQELQVLGWTSEVRSRPLQFFHNGPCLVLCMRLGQVVQLRAQSSGSQGSYSIEASASLDVIISSTSDVYSNPAQSDGHHSCQAFVVATLSNKVVAMSASPLQMIWQADVEGPVFSQPAVLVERRFGVCSCSGVGLWGDDSLGC